MNTHISTWKRVLENQPSRVQRIALCHEADMVEIGSGSFKRCFTRDDIDFVIKLAWNYDGNTGMLERVNYEAAPEEIKPFLLPILEEGDGWQIQAKADVSLSEECPSTCPMCYFDDMLHKNHKHLPDGTPVVYDYGQPDQWLDYRPTMRREA